MWQKLIVFFFLSTILGLLKINAQGVRYPDHTILYESNNAFFNNSVLSEKSTLLLGSQGYTGAFSELRIIYGTGSFVVGENKDQGLSINFYSFKEGPLISENRLKAGYWKKLSLENFDLVMGGQIGAINTAFDATRTTVGGNAWNVDIDFGATFRSKKQSLSLSLNQMVETQASPLSQTTKFKRFWTLLHTYKFELEPHLFLRSFLYSYYVFGKKHLFNAKLMATLHDRFSFGGGYGSEGLIFNLALEEMSIAEHNFTIMAAFRLPSVGAISPVSQAYALQLIYKFGESN